MQSNMHEYVMLCPDITTIEEFMFSSLSFFLLLCAAGFLERLALDFLSHLSTFFAKLLYCHGFSFCLIFFFLFLCLFFVVFCALHHLRLTEIAAAFVHNLAATQCFLGALR